MKNIYRDFLENEKGNTGLVIATVVESTGSTPQKPGSSALFDDGGLISGTVGGGVVEGQVQEAVKKCSSSGESALLHFTLGNDISNKYEAICGGRISVLVDANSLAHLPVFLNILNSISEDIPGVLITMVTPLRETRVLINRYWMTAGNRPQIPPGFMEKIEPEVMEMLKLQLNGDYRKLELSIPGEEPSSLFFLELLLTPERLIIAGAGHIGKAVSHLGRMLDFEVTMIDDRVDFANADNLPDADHIIVKDIGEAMHEVRKDQKTYIVIVTRGHNNDAEALKPCLRSDAAYIGMIGSRAKTAKMRDEFIRNEWTTTDDWNKIFTPIGLEIGSKTVEEIAVSIAAQLVMVRNKNK
ncbi:MAG: XdhC family protein [Bacteroidota bacterium]